VITLKLLARELGLRLIRWETRFGHYGHFSHSALDIQRSTSLLGEKVPGGQGFSAFGLIIW